jgi:hypothetical protein
VRPPWSVNQTKVEQPRRADSERLASSHRRMHIDLQHLTNIKVGIAISDKPS